MTHLPLIGLVLGIAAILLVAGRIRHNRRRSVYARLLGGTYDVMSGRIFIRHGDRQIEFTAVENINAYVPLPTIACSLKTTAQCDIAPAAANPMRKINQDNRPNKEIKLGGAAYSLKAEISGAAGSSGKSHRWTRV